MYFPSEKKYYFIISFSDYNRYLGGVNRVILSQIEKAKDQGISAIFICPVRIAKGVIADNQWLLRVDGRAILVGNELQVLSYLGQLQMQNYDLLAVQIHHLLKMNISSLSRILQEIYSKKFFYLHDFYSICASGNGNLFRQDDTLCSAAFCDIPDCGKCYNLNTKTKEIRSFIRQLDDNYIFVAPSDSCKKIWSSYYSEHRDKCIVIYHQKLIDKYNGRRSLINVDTQFKVAFVGKQMKTKGWDDYKYISERVNANQRYQFFCFGEDNEKIHGITNISVDFHDGLEAMTNKLRENKIDVVLLLSRCPETYSYTYYESIAAGAFILAYDVSGNIADQIRQRGNGKIFSSKDDIVKYLNDTDRVITDINNFREHGQRGPLRLEENDEFLAYLLKERGYISEDAEGYRLNYPFGRAKSALYEIESYIKKHVNKN